MPRDHTQRGGKTMPYVSRDGAEHEASFWVLDRLAVEISDSSIKLRFAAYHDISSYDSDKQPIADAVKEYIVSGEAFAAAIGMPTLNEPVPIGYEIIRLAWAVALAAHDTEVDEEMVSFFAGAADVQF